jgi:uncharacterized membrane protein
VKSIQGLLGGDIFPELLGLLYGFTALYGAMSLWLVPFTVRNPVVITGLVAGMLVISPITYAAIFKPQLYDRENWLYTMASILPFVVALTWLAYFAINKPGMRSSIAADESDVSD